MDFEGAIELLGLAIDVAAVVVISTPAPPWNPGGASPAPRPPDPGRRTDRALRRTCAFRDAPGR